MHVSIYQIWMEIWHDSRNVVNEHEGLATYHVAAVWTSVVGMDYSDADHLANLELQISLLVQSWSSC